MPDTQEQNTEKKEKTAEVIPQQAQKVEAKSDETSIEDVFYTDPKKAAQILKKQATEEALKAIDAERRKERQEKEFWDNFYSENPDLRGRERFVKLVLGEKWNELESKPTTEAKEAIAKETRQLISQASTTGGTRTELLQNPGMALPSSGPSYGGQTTETKPASFVSQIKKFQGGFKPKRS